MRKSSVLYFLKMYGVVALEGYKKANSLLHKFTRNTHMSKILNTLHIVIAGLIIGLQTPAHAGNTVLCGKCEQLNNNMTLVRANNCISYCAGIAGQEKRLNWATNEQKRITITNKIESIWQGRDKNQNADTDIESEIVALMTLPQSSERNKWKPIATRYVVQFKLATVQAIVAKIQSFDQSSDPVEQKYDHIKPLEEMLKSPKYNGVKDIATVRKDVADTLKRNIPPQTLIVENIARIYSGQEKWDVIVAKIKAEIQKLGDKKLAQVRNIKDIREKAESTLNTFKAKSIVAEIKQISEDKTKGTDKHKEIKLLAEQLKKPEFNNVANIDKLRQAAAETLTKHTNSIHRALAFDPTNPDACKDTTVLDAVKWYIDTKPWYSDPPEGNNQRTLTYVSEGNERKRYGVKDEIQDRIQRYGKKRFSTSYNTGYYIPFSKNVRTTQGSPFQYKQKIERNRIQKFWIHYSEQSKGFSIVCVERQE